MPELDWFSIGISWVFSTVTTLIILFISLCLKKRFSNKSIHDREVEKVSVVDEKNTTYIPNPFSKSAYLEWTACKPLETSSPKFQKERQQMMPLVSNIEGQVQGNEYYNHHKKSEKKRKNRVNENGTDIIQNEKKIPAKMFENAIRNEPVPLKINKVVENGLKSKMVGSEMIVDLKKSPAEKRRQSKQRTSVLPVSNRSNKRDSQDAKQNNLTKETNLTNSQKNSDRQLFFVKCEGQNGSKTNCHQSVRRTEKPSNHDQCVDKTRITQLPPRPSRQSNSLVFIKDSSKQKTSLERCHSSSPPTRGATRKRLINEKHPKLQLKVDELCYTSLPSFISQSNT